VTLERGIQFDNTPLKDHNIFYVIHQLGYGDSGACCLACTKDSAPCVLKFFRPTKNTKKDRDTVKKKADTEAKNWNTIYGNDYTFDFVKVLQIWQRSILVMPFLRVSRDKNERAVLVEDKGKDKKNSMLYKALLHFSSKGYIHTDLWWRHIGVISVKKIQPIHAGCERRSHKRTKIETTEKEDVVVFCDLGSNGSKGVVKCDDVTKRQTWVDEQFEWLEGRIGLGQ
jgi:hypothetical protein